MFGKIVEYFLNKPTRLIELGWVVFYMGGGLILTGLLGRVVTTATTVLGSHVHAVAEKTLTDIYPTLPTWWIPETLGSGLFALVIVIFGAWLILVGKKFNCFMEC